MRLAQLYLLPLECLLYGGYLGLGSTSNSNRIEFDSGGNKVKKRLPVVNNFVSEHDNILSFFEFADTPRANFLYQLLKMKPQSFKLEIGYIAKEDGGYELVEVSLVNKHSDKHPIIVKRRLADKVRVSLRKFKGRFKK